MEKTRNYGSVTKGDYFQLVIVPNVAGVNKRFGKCGQHGCAKN
jgi:hypothetical protein